MYLAVPLINNRDSTLAKDICKILEDVGCEIISEWVLWDDPNPNLKPEEVYKRDYQAIELCDLLVAEISKPSIGVGMEIMLAKTFGKKILCLHKETTISNFLKGIPNVSTLFYSNLDELQIKIDQNFLAKI